MSPALLLCGLMVLVSEGKEGGCFGPEFSGDLHSLCGVCQL